MGCISFSGIDTLYLTFKSNIVKIYKIFKKSFTRNAKENLGEIEKKFKNFL